MTSATLTSLSEAWLRVPISHRKASWAGAEMSAARLPNWPDQGVFRDVVPLGHPLASWLEGYSSVYLHSAVGHGRGLPITPYPRRYAAIPHNIPRRGSWAARLPYNKPLICGRIPCNHCWAQVQQTEAKMDPVGLIAQVRSGVAQVLLEREGQLIGSGSGFLVEGGLVTNSHNIRARSIGAVAIRFADTDPNDPASRIRLFPEDCVVAESPQDEKDYVYLRLLDSDFDNRYIFEFCDSSSPLSVGERVVFLGFPFGMPQMTAHIGYVSSIHGRNGVEIIQIDGSVNGGNSGGPLLDLKTGKVAGVVTRAVTGFIEEQFDRLMEALRQNQIACQGAQSIMQIGNIDPIQAIGASQAAMERIARDLHRSANVGIGYTYSARYVRDHIARILE